LNQTKISFCIITNGNNEAGLSRVIKSILRSNLPDSEILVLGQSSLLEANVKFIDFNENEKPGWITRKKNLLAKVASGEILIIMHDYIELDYGWNMSLQKSLLENDWEVAIPKIFNLDGTRYRDWLIWPHNGIYLDKYFSKTRRCLMPYTLNLVPDLMYVSGAFFMCKRQFFLSNTLDESLAWGEGEDVEWSKRVRDKWKLKVFRHCGVRLQKQKEVLFVEAGVFTIILVISYSFASKIRKIFVKLPSLT
jgi:hypothetical protein